VSRTRVGAKKKKKKRPSPIPDKWPIIDPDKLPLPRIPAWLIWKLLPTWAKVGLGYLVYRELTRGS